MYTDCTVACCWFSWCLLARQFGFSLLDKLPLEAVSRCSSLVYICVLVSNTWYVLGAGIAVSHAARIAAEVQGPPFMYA
jgi:hypothetical protein